MELYESRVLNGVLKAYDGECYPEHIANRLACDILISAPPSRATENDLWPCIWALAAALVRQFTGRIYVRAGLQGPLAQPSALGPRIEFTSSCPPCAIEIVLGTKPVSDAPMVIKGDVRDRLIMRGSTGETYRHTARAEGCFALAGYLGFEALARAAGIPAFQPDLCKQEILLPSPSEVDGDLLHALNLEFLGLGHLGNAYLALMFFICRGKNSWPHVSIVDKDRLGPENWSTHVLVGEHDQSFGEFKTHAIARLAHTWGCELHPMATEVTWNWKVNPQLKTFGILGFDTFDARRMALNADYDWIVESGLSTSFSEPLLSWHSFNSRSSTAKQVFPRTTRTSEIKMKETPFTRDLKSRDGGCGFVRYAGIDASAPSMGLLASAYVWSEIFNGLDARRTPHHGTARLWSPFLPFWRRGL